MMKKLQNIAAIFAAGALLLGAASCSHDGGASLAALGKEDKNPPPTKGASISFDANKGEGSRFVKSDDEGVFSNVKEEFGAYSIGTTWTILSSTDQSIKAAKFSYKSADTPKLKDYELLTGADTGKVNMTGWLLTCSSSDENNGLSASEKGTEIASTTYTFTLAKKAKVTASQVAFNGQSNDVNGQISILDSSNTVKGSATGESATKEDNDAAITDAVELAAGTYKLKFAWVTSKASATIKKWNCGVEKFTLTATPVE